MSEKKEEKVDSKACWDAMEAQRQQVFITNLLMRVAHPDIIHWCRERHFRWADEFEYYEHLCTPGNVVHTVVVHQDGGMGYLCKSAAQVAADNQRRVKFCVYTLEGNQVFPIPVQDDKRPCEDFAEAMHAFNMLQRDLGVADDDEGDEIFDLQRRDIDFIALFGQCPVCMSPRRLCCCEH